MSSGRGGSPAPRRNNRQPRRNGQDALARPEDFWRAVPEPAVPGDITPAGDPTALLRSLGPPPLPDQTGADRTVAAVVARASALATALAAAADILATDEDP